MNKSKFLKKSLALLLSVMMVVAMIPLGASAAWTVSNTDDVVEVTTSEGTIDKASTTTGTVTLPYDNYSNKTGTKLSVLFQNTVDSVVYKVGTAAEASAKVTAGTAVEITVPAAATDTTVVFTPSKGATKGAEYTITVKNAVASSDTSLKEAKIGTGDTAIKGVVSGSTVTVTVPWGYPDASATVTLVPNTPVTGVEKYDVSVPMANGTGTKNQVVPAQSGDSKNYTVTVSEAQALTSLKVGGVDATLNEKNGHYEVKLPIGTDMTKDLPVVFAAADLKGATWNPGNTTAASITSGKSVKVAASNELVLTNKAGNTYTKSYTVDVAITDNDQAVVESFTLTDGTYTAEGKVSGETMTAELPYSAALNPVTAVITASKGSKVNGNAVDSEGKVTLSGLDLRDDKTVRIAVEAQDGKKTFYYSLSATKADTRNNSNDVSAMKMTIGSGDDAVDYSGARSGNTFTFTVPYATDATKIAGANFVGAYPSGCTLKDSNGATITKPVATGYADNDLKATVTFTVTSETGRLATYTIKFAKQAAKTGKTLSGVSFANATTADAVKSENTYAGTVSGKTLTATFPYSAQTNVATYATMTPTFTVSEGAKLYKVSGGNLVEMKSGFYTAEDEEADPAHVEGTAKDSVALADFWDAAKAESKETVLYVLDESAVFEVDTKKNNTIAKLQALEEDEKFYKAHVAEIAVDPKFAAAQTGASLTGITDETGKVTGAMSGSTLTITVPGSYVRDAVEFSVVWAASPMATVEAGSADLNATGTLFKVTNAGTADEPKYEIYTGTTTGSVNTKFSDVDVTNEAGNNTRTFKVEVKANPIQTGALVTAAKFNDTAAVINNSAWTITATVPATTDLKKVKLALTGSTMAKVEIVDKTDAPVAVVKDEKGKNIDDTYDLSAFDEKSPMKVKVTAEDNATVNYYTVVVKTEEVSFTDVKSGDWFYDDVIAAATAGIVSGYPDKTYKPNNNIKRKDFAVMVASMMGADLTKYTTSAFSDVAHDYAEKAIAYCGETGIIAGKAAGKFAPNDFITREQAATIVARALKLQSTSANKFADDASISSWATNGVYACVASGIIEGVGNNTFAPKKNLTRAQAARILVLALNQK